MTFSELKITLAIDFVYEWVNFLMSALPNSYRYIDRPPETLHQGAEVFFHFPYAANYELKRFQKGVILSHGLNERPCICPISTQETATDLKYGIPIERPNGKIEYIRPDAASFLAADYCGLAMQKEKGRPKILPAEYLQKAIERFIGALTPGPEKLQQQLNGYLGYGQVGWLYKIPRITADVHDSAPILCLTPPTISRETGIMHIARGYSNNTTYRQRVDVAVGNRHWFSLGFFSARDIRAIDWRSPDRTQTARPFTLIGGHYRDLRALCKKSHGLLNPEIQRQIHDRYSDRPGDLPDFLAYRGLSKATPCHPR